MRYLILSSVVADVYPGTTEHLPAARGVEAGEAGEAARPAQRLRPAPPRPLVRGRFNLPADAMQSFLAVREPKITLTTIFLNFGPNFLTRLH